MKLEKYKQHDKWQTVFKITFDDMEIVSLKLNGWDRMLLDDINYGENVTIADQLLGLEMLARRIEEAQHEKT